MKRKAGGALTHYLNISSEGDMCHWTFSIAWMNIELHFKLGETFDETTGDRRQVKVKPTTSATK